MELANRLEQIRVRIAQAALRVGRNPDTVTLVGVSKTVERPIIEAAYGLGLRDFGENRIVDAEERFEPLPYPPGAARLHLIGHLQTNKAKRAVSLFDMIHSVDSIKLGQTLNRQATELNKRLPILIQVNVSGEVSKEGLEPADLPATLEALNQSEQLDLCGLMTIAPFTATAEDTRPVFYGLRELFEKSSQYVKIACWQHLSMGMTNDFEVAIEEGATIVRVGRAIFQ